VLGFTVLDVAVGPIFVYPRVSLVITTASELIASCLKPRAEKLWKGFQRLLETPLAEKFYDRTLIRKLVRAGQRPSYTSSHTFALVLLDILAKPTSEAASDGTGCPEPAEGCSGRGGAAGGERAVRTRKGWSCCPW
jgi:hypothetical protein